jgi:hypothetical protein
MKRENLVRRRKFQDAQEKMKTGSTTPNEITVRPVLRPDRRLTRPEPIVIPVKPFIQNQVYPLPDFFQIFVR